MTQPVPCVSCAYSQKEISAPGGLLYSSQYWHIGHVVPLYTAGHLVIWSASHVENPADLSEDAVLQYGVLLKRMWRAIQVVTGAERVHDLRAMEAAPHVHTHVIPRLASHPTTPSSFYAQLFARQFEVSEREVLPVVVAIKPLLQDPPRPPRYGAVQLAERMDQE